MFTSIPEPLAMVSRLVTTTRDLLRETGHGTQRCELKWVHETAVALTKVEAWLVEQAKG